MTNKTKRQVCNAAESRLQKYLSAGCDRRCDVGLCYRRMIFQHVLGLIQRTDLVLSHSSLMSSTFQSTFFESNHEFPRSTI